MNCASVKSSEPPGLANSCSPISSSKVGWFFCSSITFIAVSFASHLPIAQEFYTVLQCIGVQGFGEMHQPAEEITDWTLLEKAPTAFPLTTELVIVEGSLVSV